MHAYADVVFNHRIGADETEDVSAPGVRLRQPQRVAASRHKIKAWTHYKFPGRGASTRLSSGTGEHFNAFELQRGQARRRGKIYRVVGQDVQRPRSASSTATSTT